MKSHQLPLRNLPVAIPIDETDLVGAWQQALIQLDLDPKTDAYVLALPHGGVPAHAGGRGVCFVKFLWAVSAFLLVRLSGCF